MSVITARAAAESTKWATAVDDRKVEGTRGLPDEPGRLHLKTLNRFQTISRIGARLVYSPQLDWLGFDTLNARNRNRPFFRRPMMLLLSAASILIGSIFGLQQYLHARSHESTDDAFIDAHITQLSPKIASHVVKLHIMDNQRVNAGDLLIELDPRDFEARLAEARAALQAAEARHRAAEAIAEQTRISARGGVEEASSGLSAALASLEMARAQVRAAGDRERQAQAMIKAAQAAAMQTRAQIGAAEAEGSFASADAQRLKLLYADGLVSRQLLDQTTARAQTASAQLAAAREREAAALAQVEVARAAAASALAEWRQAETQAQQAEAGVGEAKGRLTGASAAPQQVKAGQEQASSASESVEQARAGVKLAELQLSYTKIYAPVSGRVTRRSVEVGDYVGAGEELMAIVPDNLYVTANYKETQLKLMKPGQPVDIRIDAFPNKTFKGRVDSIQRGSGAAFSLLPPENATGNYVKIVQRVPVKIVFDEPLDPTYPIGPGMSVVPEVRVR
jgi:membrane fusion protein (multidrug efflux system)